MKKILRFGDIKIEKTEFYRDKSPVPQRDPDTEKVIASRKISSGEKNYKYLIGYLHNDHKVKPLHIILPKTSDYVKTCDGQTKWMYFYDLLETYITIWDKVSADIKKELDNEPA